jgi:hypothetical protein
VEALAGLWREGVRRLAGPLLWGWCAVLCAQAPVKREFFGRRLEPSASVILHGAGQSDETSFAGYSKAMGEAKPMLSMSYVDLHEDLPAFFARLKAELARYPEQIVPQIGLSFNQGEAKKQDDEAVGRGDEDWRLEALCAGLRSLGRPVFLRVGYEFNGSWNGYGPAGYVAAFRRVAEKVRAAGLEDVALVWDWSADAELDAERGGARGLPVVRYGGFYPGDDVVDWWGVNLFTAESLSAGATKSFLEDARRHRFPVMIGESAPRGVPVTLGQVAIDRWYRPYFGLIEGSPGVKAFCYIDWDWSAYPQWASWGDSRVEDDPIVLRFWRGEFAKPIFADARGAVETQKLLRVR